MRMTKIVNKILCMALCLTSCIATAQTIGKVEEKGSIEVTGTAEKEVIPDEIYIQITLRERYINKNKIGIEEQEEKLKNAIKSLGLDLKNLFLSDANADYVKIRWKTKDILTKKDYNMKVADAKTLGKVFQELEKIEITDAFIARVNHSKLDSLKKEIKITAIKSAKEKADYLLAAIGEQAGRPMLIQENESIPYQPMLRMTTRSAETAVYNLDASQAKAEENYEIEFQKIKIATSVFVRFSIK